MIIRKVQIIFFGLILIVSALKAEDPKKYDTNDWIPIAQPNPENEEDKVPIVEKKATGRVLNLAEPPPSNFFPDEGKQGRSNNYQFLRETSTVNQPLLQFHRQPIRHKQPAPLQHPYRFEGPPQAVHSIPQSPRPLRPLQQKQEPSQQQFYLQQQPKQEFISGPPQFSQHGAQYFPQPQEYHTIPEEYLTQQGLAQPSNIPYHLQGNYQQIPNIPDLPPIRLNATASHEAINDEYIDKRKPVKQIDITSTTPKENENVQLVYVPLESLNQHPRPESHRLQAYQQTPYQDVQQKFINYQPTFTNKQQQQILNIENDFAKQALEAHKLQQQFQQHPLQPHALPLTDPTPPPTTTTTTRKPASKKRKPHQPPLAVYMDGDKNADIADVLTLLKNAKTIDVQDSVGPDSPKIFVGPSNLEAPTTYAKFELPYLSSVDNNRVERKVDQLPFFVAPLSYKAPPGYSKIPLPSPHVGSVVVSNKQKALEEEVAARPAPSQQNILDSYKPYTLKDEQSFPREHYTTDVISASTPKYHKPIAEDHVINQYELDQINGFIPQYNIQQQPIQQEPEKYSFDSFQEVQRRPQQPATYELAAEQPYKQFNSHRTTETNIRAKPNFGNTQVFELEKPNQSTPPLNAQEQYTPEVTPEEKPTFNSIQQTRNTHSSTRGSTTLIPNEQYHKEVSPTRYYEEAPPTPSLIRGRPQIRDQYLKDKDNYDTIQHTRQPPRRTRPTPAPQQYYKETSSEARPTVSRTRQHTTPAPRQQYYELNEEIPESRFTYKTKARSSTAAPAREQFLTVSELPTKYTNDAQFISSTPSPIHQVSEQHIDIAQPSSPKHSNRDQLVYSPRPTQNTYSDIDVKPKEKYTILEEYNQNQKPTTAKFSYTGDDIVSEEIYRNKPQSNRESQDDVYTIRNQPVYSPTQTPGIHENKYVLNQQELDTKILGRQQESANYVTGPQQIYEQSLIQSNPEAVNAYKPKEQFYSEASYDNKEVKTQNANVENYNLPIQISSNNQVLPSLINNLEDQSVRQLLHPGLVPTSTLRSDILAHEISIPSSTYSPEPITTTTSAPTTYPSTHMPVVETTTKRLRGRQRGNRYSTTTPSSATRRTTTRGRRPLPSRTRYQDENASTTEYPARSTTDPTKKIVNSRSRFRTRGRPAQTESPVSTTSKYSYDDSINATPLHEQSTARIHHEHRSSYTPTARNIDDDERTVHVTTPRILHAQHSTIYDQSGDEQQREYISSTARILNERVTPRIQPNDDQYIINSYQPVYNLPSEYSNVLPVNQRVVEIGGTASDIVAINDGKSSSHESTERATSRTKSRVRSRPRLTTVTPRAEQSRREESDEAPTEDFYGFFRQPNFKKSDDQGPSPTEIPQRPVYSASYVSSTLKPLVRYPDDDIIQQNGITHRSNGEESASTPVHFVGEIRPKYYPTSTAKYYEVSQTSASGENHYPTTVADSSNANKVKIRGRIRVPGRREETVERQRTNNDLLVKEETSTRAPIRGRTRGKNHYKPPTKPKETSDEDVEGGNYPPQFRAPVTPSSRFQITVDPLLDDQEPYSSIYRPTYIAKEANNKEQAQSLPSQSLINNIQNEEKESNTEPKALPITLDNENIPSGDDAQLQTGFDDEKFIEVENAEENDEYLTTTVLPETTTKHTKRRGVWKLVKRPVDVLEGAESQNLGNSNANSFGNQDKFQSDGKISVEKFSDYVTTIKPSVEETAVTTNKTEGGFFNSLYEMFGISNKDNLKETSDSSEVTTENFVDVTTLPTYETTDKQFSTDKFVHEEDVQETTEEVLVPTTQSFHESLHAVEEPVTTRAPMSYVTPMSLETWNLVKTSTSTEISHETEICYKGRCIKSKDMKIPTT